MENARENLFPFNGLGTAFLETDKRNGVSVGVLWQDLPQGVSSLNVPKAGLRAGGQADLS